jgi:hypothetical protein
MPHAVLRLYTDSGELVSKIKENEAEVRELLSSIPGFQFYGIADTGTGAFTFTACEDKAGTDESIARAARWIKANMPDANIAPPRVIEGESALQIVARPPADTGAHILLRMFGPEALTLLRNNEAKIRELMTRVTSFSTYVVLDTGTGGVSLTVADNKAGIDEVASHMVPWIQSQLPGVNPVETLEGDDALHFSGEGVRA